MLKIICGYLFPAWMLWGIGFDSESETSSTQTTNQTDKRATGGDNSVNITGDAASVVVHPTDYGAVTAGLEIAGLSVNDSATLAHDAVGGSLALSSKALDSNAKAIDANANISQAAIDAALKSGKESAALASSVAKDSMGLASDFASNTRRTFGDALDFAGSTASAASKAERAVFGDALSFAGAQASSASKAEKGAFEGALSTVSDAYETAKAGDQKIVSMVALAVVALAAVVAFAGNRAKV